VGYGLGWAQAATLGGSPDHSKEGAMLAIVPPPLKCITLCKQQTLQQHGAVDLFTGTVCHSESMALDWTHPLHG